MSDIEKKHKISSMISIIAIVFCMAAIIISIVNLRYTIVNELETGTALPLLFCNISILFANITIYLASNRKYKNSINETSGNKKV
jgi:uncharacterized membrane protein